jgi:phosphoribosylamine---glycine ligase
VVLARLRSPLGALLMAAATGQLADVRPLEWSADAAVTVVIASAGYPDSPRTGDEIRGLDEAAGLADVFHGGTTLSDGAIVSSGGRVLSVTALGPTVRAARDRAYEAVDCITLAGSHHRRDIAASVKD